MKLPAAHSLLTLLVSTLLVYPACAPSGDIEPVPSPMTPPVFSALAAESGWVSVAGEAGSVRAGVQVVLRNESSHAFGATDAAADGSFALTIPASRGDRLRLSAKGQDDVEHTAAGPSAAAPPAPGSEAAAPGVAGPDERGRFWIGCGAGCLPAGGGLVVYAVSSRGGMLARADVSAAGAFGLAVEGPPGAAVFVFAARDDSAGPSTTVYLPAGEDDDGDGFDASVDCDDTSEDVRPGAEERCNATDDDCDGEIDEGCEDEPCVGPGCERCTGDDDCPPGLVCQLASGRCRPSAPDPDDRDGDGVPRREDVCPNDYDPEQADYDSDGKGDVCDNDADGDQSPQPQDCDDGDPRRGHNFPEACGDGLDNDCDGQTDEGCGAAPPDDGADDGEGEGDRGRNDEAPGGEDRGPDDENGPDEDRGRGE